MALTKEELREMALGLKAASKVKKDRLNATGELCIEMAELSLHAAAEAGFIITEGGATPSLSYLKEARQCIKQALDADQKNSDQKIREVLERIKELERDAGIADGLH